MNAQKPITLEQYNNIQTQDKPFMLKFWADWCGPCKALSPVMDEVATENEGVDIYTVDVDKESGLAQKFGIRGIPTMIFFKNGQAVQTMVGNQPKAEIVKALQGLA